MRWLDGTTSTIDMSLSRLWEVVEADESGVLQPSVGRSQTQLGD